MGIRVTRAPKYLLGTHVVLPLRQIHNLDADGVKTINYPKPHLEHYFENHVALSQSSLWETQTIANFIHFRWLLNSYSNLSSTTGDSFSFSNRHSNILIPDSPSSLIFQYGHSYCFVDGKAQDASPDEVPVSHECVSLCYHCYGGGVSVHDGPYLW